jgi:hypothetical protein
MLTFATQESEWFVNDIVKRLFIHILLQVVFENIHGSPEPLRVLVRAMRGDEEVWGVPQWVLF